jgi:hypothetical protein
MTRPREPVADAYRIARSIVLEEGGALAFAARGADEAVIEEAGARLACRIAEAILDAERNAIGEATAAAKAGDPIDVDSYLRAFIRC